MKIIFAFALFIAAVSGLPRQHLLKAADFQNERIVSDIIISAINDLSQDIKDAGLDPVEIDQFRLAYALPVPVLFNFDSIIEEFDLVGLSNIRVNNVNYGIITSRLTFDIELPRIALSLRKAAINVELFGTPFNAAAGGSVSINKIGITGIVRVSVGIISGISIRDMTMNFSLDGIDSALYITYRDHDFSNFVNTFLGETIPNTLADFSSEINQLLEIIATDIANEIL